MKYLAVPILLASLVWPTFTAAEESVELRVSATVPPRACEYPEPCEAADSKALPALATRVVVTEEQVSYVGSPPTVEKKDDLLVVKF